MTSASKELRPGVGEIVGRRREADQMELAVGVDPSGDQDRLGGRVRVEPEVGDVEEQAVETELGQVTGRKSGEVVLDLLADPAHGRFRQRCLVAEDLSQLGELMAPRPYHPNRGGQQTLLLFLGDLDIDGICFEGVSSPCPRRRRLRLAAPARQ